MCNDPRMWAQLFNKLEEEPNPTRAVWAKCVLECFSECKRDVLNCFDFCKQACVLEVLRSLELRGG